MTLTELLPGRSFRVVHPLSSGAGPGSDDCNIFDAIRRPGLVVKRGVEAVNPYQSVFHAIQGFLYIFDSIKLIYIIQ